MSKITKDTLVIDVLNYVDREKAIALLQSFGMHCIGCALAHHETIEQAAGGHGADINALVDGLNALVID